MRNEWIYVCQLVRHYRHSIDSWSHKYVSGANSSCKKARSYLGNVVCPRPADTCINRNQYRRTRGVKQRRTDAATWEFAWLILAESVTTSIASRPTTSLGINIWFVSGVNSWSQRPALRKPSKAATSLDSERRKRNETEEIEYRTNGSRWRAWSVEYCRFHHSGIGWNFISNFLIYRLSLIRNNNICNININDHFYRLYYKSKNIIFIANVTRVKICLLIWSLNISY